MRLLVKTLEQQQFHIEVELEDTVRTVKEKIEKEKEFTVDSQKIIYSGRILKDDVQLKDHNLKETDFIVVMVTKAKPKPKEPPKKQPETSTSAAKSDETSSSTAPATETPAAPTATPASTDPATTETSGDDANALLTGTKFESAVQNLMELGFERPQVVSAMKAAFHNPERAAEYLLSEIPADLVQAQQQMEDPAFQAALQSGGDGAAPAVATGGDANAPTDTSTPQNLFELAAQQRHQSRGGDPGGGAGAGGDLSFLRSNAQFQQLRDMIRANPSLLQPLLAQIGQTNPHLLQVINSNPAAFLRLLRQDLQGGAGAGGEGGGLPAGLQLPEGAEGEGAVPAGTQEVYLTPEERDAIERLEQLGFDRAVAVEAYFACDKNEQLAANYLFDHGDEED